MIAAIDLDAAFASLTEYWSPKVVGRVNDQLIKIAKLKGAFVWHDHAGEDELFFIVKGCLRIELEDGVVALTEGQFATVPRGVRHNPVADSECWVMLIEPASTLHTGDAVTARTRTLEQQMR